MNYDKEDKDLHNEDEQAERDEASASLDQAREVSEDKEQEQKTEEKHTQKYEGDFSKKKKRKWPQTIMSGVIGSVLTLGLVFYTPIQTLLPQDESTEEFSLPSKESDSQLVGTVADVESGDLADMVEDASKAIVGIVKYNQGGNPFAQFHDELVQGGSGSGVIIKSEGDEAYIVTNNHVIENAERIEVSLENGETEEAELVGADALSDLAVLRIANDHVEKVLTFGDSSDVRTGESAVAIGNPLGIELSRTVTRGIVSAVDRTINVETSAGNWDLNVIQTDAAINPGNSGGALLNMNGEVIGINSLKISSGGVEGLGFAIPSNDVVPLVEEMVLKGAVARPYMGISMVDITQIPRSYLEGLPEDVESGVAITEVDPNSPSGRAGIEAGDVIVKVNETDIETTEDIRDVLYKELKVGDEASVELYRKGEKQTVKVTLSSNLME
ncbi:MAG TPA: trypsin-like peptidase domain-containing protein [Pseudogracilibacillus sp.]|nr:trypsin-like peptidase domain-containing protein [Pseudogracilibacillus sp.]